MGSDEQTLDDELVANLTGRVIAAKALPILERTPGG
jgi:hypothetical protein